MDEGDIVSNILFTEAIIIMIIWIIYGIFWW